MRKRRTYSTRGIELYGIPYPYFLYAQNSILTNLHPDHLDWHSDLSEYYNAKLNLLGHTKNLILYPESTIAILPELPHFPIESVVMADHLDIDHGLLTLTPEALIDISDRQLLGEHNLVNIFLAASLALRLGVGAKTLSIILPSIPALPHRLQQISDRDGKIWIDDSKSTTAQSLCCSSCIRPNKVHLIAGGKDKGDTFD